MKVIATPLRDRSKAWRFPSCQSIICQGPTTSLHLFGCMARTVFEFKRQWKVEVDNISELFKPLLINCITHQLLSYYSFTYVAIENVFKLLCASCLVHACAKVPGHRHASQLVKVDAHFCDPEGEVMMIMIRFPRRAVVPSNSFYSFACPAN